MAQDVRLTIERLEEAVRGKLLEGREGRVAMEMIKVRLVGI